MDRRQVHDVEAHIGDVGQPGFAIGKSSVLSRIRSSRAREQLIPCTEASANGINRNHKFTLELAGEPAVGIAPHDIIERAVGGSLTANLYVAFRAKRKGFAGQPTAIRTFRSDCRFVDQVCSNLIVDGRFVVGLNAFQQVAAPCFPMIDPSVNGEKVTAQFGEFEFACPTVVHQRAQRTLLPVAIALMTRKKNGGDGIVAVGKDIGFHAHGIAECPLSGKSASVNFRGNSFNDDSLTSVGLRLLHVREIVIRARCVSP